MKIEDILAITDVDQKIKQLKQRRGSLPDVNQLRADWIPSLHQVIIDKVKYPNRKVLIEDAKTIYDDKTGETVVIPAKYEEEEVNRISLPIEQDIVNIHTAFTVGTEPKLECTPNDEQEKELIEIIKATYRKNKIKFQNKKIVRSWLSETEVAEYWYAVDDTTFWDKIWAKIQYACTGKIKPKRRLKSVIWSPFRGDKLYPLFNDYGDLVAFSRGYNKTVDTIEYECFMTITQSDIYIWENKEGWQLVDSFKHGFHKIPVIYTQRKETLCNNIKPLRERIEKLLSNYADCIDYHFFPYLMLTGEIEGFTGKQKNRMIKFEGEGSNASYLAWQQAPDTIKLELDTMFEQMYSLTNTPRISFENLKGAGNALSGTAFRFTFMGAHMAVENHAEDIGEFFQRRTNFVTSAISSINSKYEKASNTIDIDVEIIPYMIDSLSERVKTAIDATSGGIWSKREGILFAGNADRIDEELKEIENENSIDEVS